MNQIIISLFIVVLVYHSFNLPFRVKRLLGKRFKVLECLPCFTFWTALGVSLAMGFDPISIMTSFLIAFTFDSWKN